MIDMAINPDDSAVLLGRIGRFASAQSDCTGAIKRIQIVFSCHYQ
jgi:hypothetical protein